MVDVAYRSASSSISWILMVGSFGCLESFGSNVWCRILLWPGCSPSCTAAPCCSEDLKKNWQKCRFLSMVFLFAFVLSVARSNLDFSNLEDFSCASLTALFGLVMPYAATLGGLLLFYELLLWFLEFCSFVSRGSLWCFIVSDFQTFPKFRDLFSV